MRCCGPTNIISAAGNFFYDYSYSGGGQLPTAVSYGNDDFSTATTSTYFYYDGLKRPSSTGLSTPFDFEELDYAYDTGSEVTQQVFTANNLLEDHEVGYAFMTPSGS